MIFEGLFSNRYGKLRVKPKMLDFFQTSDIELPVLNPLKLEGCTVYHLKALNNIEW